MAMSVDVVAAPQPLDDYLKVVEEHLADSDVKKDEMGLSGGMVRWCVFQLLVMECGRPAPPKSRARFAACLYTLFVTEHLALQRRRILGFDAEALYETACSVCAALESQASLVDAIADIDQTGLAKWMIQQPGQLEALFAGSRPAAKRKRAPKRSKEALPDLGEAAPVAKKPSPSASAEKPPRSAKKPSPRAKKAAATTAQRTSGPSYALAEKPLETLALETNLEDSAEINIDSFFAAPLLDLSVDEAVDFTPALF